MAGGTHAGGVKIGGVRFGVKCGVLRGRGRRQGGQKAKQRRGLRAVRGCSEVASKQG